MPRFEVLYFLYYFKIFFSQAEHGASFPIRLLTLTISQTSLTRFPFVDFRHLLSRDDDAVVRTKTNKCTKGVYCFIDQFCVRWLILPLCFIPPGRVFLPLRLVFVKGVYLSRWRRGSWSDACSQLSNQNDPNPRVGSWQQPALTEMTARALLPSFCWGRLTTELPVGGWSDLTRAIWDGFELPPSLLVLMLAKVMIILVKVMVMITATMS